MVILLIFWFITIVIISFLLALFGYFFTPFIALAIMGVIFCLFFFVFAVFMTIVGMVGDYIYDKKMVLNEVPYRLPWYYRLNGWQLDSSDDTYTYKPGMFYDSRVGRIVCMVRP